MPNSALGLTYASYKSDATLTANMQIWLKDRAVDQVFNGVPLFRYLTGRDQKEMTLDQIKASAAHRIELHGSLISQLPDYSYNAAAGYRSGVYKLA